MSLNIYQGTIRTHAANHRQYNDQKKRKNNKKTRNGHQNSTQKLKIENHERY